MVSREVEITIDKISVMKDRKRVATRYAQSKEHLEILKELLDTLDVQVTDDERDNSKDLTDFNFNL